MPARWLLSLSVASVLATACPAADLAKVPRAIGKEPAYATKAPRYLLLAFGPNAADRVWVVLDGDTLYVDRNGNGDLTEKDESTGPESTNTDPCSFNKITLRRPDGKEEELSFALFGWFDYKAGKVGDRFSPSISVWWDGRWFGSWGDETGPCVWGQKPADAPVLHVGGPLQMGFEVPAASAVERKGDGEFEVKVGVGTKGLGKGSFVHLTYARDAIPKGVYPTAELEFPARERGAPPVRVRAVLKQRC
jgi:hypothetical protein